jgi:transposase
MSDDVLAWDVAIGIDWADQKHDYALEDGTLGEFANTAEAISKFVRQLHDKYPNKRIAICLEQTHGSLVYALLEFETLVIYPINPSQLAYFRKALHPGGKSDDECDAMLLMQILKLHHSKLRPWRPDCSEVRALKALVEHRRMFVDERTKLTLRLQASLKKYFPLALGMACDYHSELFLDLLKKWPTQQKLQRQKPEYLAKFFRGHGCRSEERVNERIMAIRRSQPLVTDSGIIEPQSMLVLHLVKQIRELNRAIENYDRQIATYSAKLEDTKLFAEIRGVGKQLAPRLVAAFGTDRDRFQTAADIQAYAGTAPVTKKSGKKKTVTRRYACPTFLRQTFHEFAEQMRKYSQWSRSYYQLLISRGKTHHVAVRALAFKWTRILFAVWKNRTRYDEEKYIAQLIRRKSPIASLLEPNLNT